MRDGINNNITLQIRNKYIRVQSCRRLLIERAVVLHKLHFILYRYICISNLAAEAKFHY